MKFQEIDINEDETIARTLKRGMKGADVRRIQRELGMPKREQDGIFGKKTEKAVRTFQKNMGIQVDGMVGQQTQSAILKTRMLGTKINVLKPGPAYIDAPYPDTPKSSPKKDIKPKISDLRRRQMDKQKNAGPKDSPKGSDSPRYYKPVDPKDSTKGSDSPRYYAPPQSGYMDAPKGKSVPKKGPGDTPEPKGDPLKGKDLPSGPGGDQALPQYRPKGDALGMKKDPQNMVRPSVVAPLSKRSYKIVTGSGQGKRYKLYDKNGNLIKSGRGAGPRNVPQKKLVSVKDSLYNSITKELGV